jgi:DNA-binding transcriptional LysR family regulator
VSTVRRVLVALHPEHPALPKRGPIAISRCGHTAWAAGHRGTGLDSLIRNVCNRLGDYEPDVRHRSDDGLILGALVALGRAVTLLPGLLATNIPQIVVRRLATTAGRISRERPDVEIVAA